MLERVCAHISSLGILPPAARLLAGVSGGPDSMALLDILARLRPVLGFDLACATVDHGLRPDAGREAALVEREARARSVPWVLLGGDARGRARRDGGGIEEAARDLRADLLLAEARRVGAIRIALGHTLDDQAETVIMRLMRGTALHGLAGMSPERGRLWIRPLIVSTRADVLAYLEKNGIPWCEDPMNRDRRFLRVRVRTEILPALAACDPSISRRLAALADRARAAGRAMDGIVDLLIDRMATRRGGDLCVDRKALLGLDPSIASYVVRGIYVRLVGNARRLTRRHVAAVLGLCDSGEGAASVDLPRGARAVRAYDEILFSASPSEHPGEQRVDGPGEHVSGSIRILVEASPGCSAFPLDLRGRRPGDRLAGRTRSLKRLLIDRKVPRPLRSLVPLLASGGDVVWAGGLYLAQGCGIRVSMRPAGPSAYLDWLERRLG